MKLNALHKYWNSTISFSRPEAGGSPKKGRSRPESEGERHQAWRDFGLLIFYGDLTTAIGQRGFCASTNSFVPFLCSLYNRCFALQEEIVPDRQRGCDQHDRFLVFLGL